MFGISTQLLWKIYIEDIDGDCRSESVPTLRLTEDCKYLDIFCLHQVAVVNTWPLCLRVLCTLKQLQKLMLTCMRCNMFKIFVPVYMYICLCS